MEEIDRKEERAELAARVAGAAIQHGLGEVVSESDLDPALLKKHDSVAKEVAEVAMKKGLVKGEDLADVSLASIHAVALDAASAAIQKGWAKDETEPEMTEKQKTQMKELSILAASSAMQHHFGEEAIQSDMLKKVCNLAHEAADAAIDKKLVPDERHDPTLQDVAEVARQAASAAIQKLLAVEDREMHDALHDQERQKVAMLAASAALQHGHDTERPNASSLKTLSSISKSAAEAALKKVGTPPEDIDEGHFRDAQEAAQFAIDHNLIDHPEPPMELVAEVARMAAAAAIQRGLEDETVTENRIAERKEILASIARDVASFAIQKGLGAEVVPNRKRAYELAVLAASAAMRRQEQRQEEPERIPPAQLAEVAIRAAREAVRLGYGVDEAEAMLTPKTPPAADHITSPEDVHTQKTEHVHKEESASTQRDISLVYRESEVEEVTTHPFCMCFSKFLKSKRKTS